MCVSFVCVYMRGCLHVCVRASMCVCVRVCVYGQKGAQRVFSESPWLLLLGSKTQSILEACRHPLGALLVEVFNHSLRPTYNVWLVSQYHTCRQLRGYKWSERFLCSWPTEEVGFAVSHVMTSPSAIFGMFKGQGMHGHKCLTSLEAGPLGQRQQPVHRLHNSHTPLFGGDDFLWGSVLQDCRQGHMHVVQYS